MYRLASAALFLFICSIPLADVFLLPGIGSLSVLTGGPAFAIGVVAVATSGRLRAPTTLHALMIAFVVWVGVAYQWSLNPAGAVINLRTYAQLLIMVWLIWEFSRRKGQYQALMRAYVLGSAGASLWTVLNYLTGQGLSGSQRYSVEGFNPNSAGILAAVSLPLAFYLAEREKRPLYAWLYRLHMALAGCAVLLTASRTATLACAGAVLIVPWFRAKQSAKKRLALAVAVLIGTISIFTLVPTYSWERISTTGTEISTGDISGRRAIWEVGLELFLESPIVGIGTTSFHAATPQYFGKRRASHSTFLSILVQQGLVGFFLFVSIVGGVVWSALHLPQLERRVGLAILAAWGLGALAGDLESVRLTWFVFSLVLVQAADLGHANNKRKRVSFSTQGLALRFLDAAGKPQQAPSGQRRVRVWLPVSQR